MRPHERWIWVEPIGFDAEQPDLGVGQYLDTCGFIPHTVCLLMTSPDFVLSHEDHAGEVDLPPDFCARDGHEFGRDRQRQVWTNRQLQGLIANLQARGVRVFLTVFSAWYRDQYHHEWLSDHREVFMVFRQLGVGYAINPVARLADGTPFADLWARKLVQTLEYYGFDGWQGADGWGPLSGPLYYTDYSDDTVEQFALWLESRDAPGGPDAPPVRLAPHAAPPGLPPQVLAPWNEDLAKLEGRADWIWRHARREWIDFWSDRWADFWRTVMTALHAAGKEAVINSAWGRAPFEALYRYGVDYRKIAAAGVDGMIVETAAAGLSLDPRACDDKRHFDFLSMFALVRAYLPDLRLIFLHNAHDIVEQWDAIRHVPAVLEKEIFALANVYVTRRPLTPGPSPAAGSGLGRGESGIRLQPAADGFLVCLGDGFTREEWGWLERKWQFSFSQSPRRIVGVTLVWSDALMQAEIDDLTQTRRPHSHRLLYELLAAGAPVGAAVRVEDLSAAEGPLLVLNAHLLAEEERAELEAYDRGVVLGVAAEGVESSSDLKAMIFPTPPLSGDMFGFIDERDYWSHLVQRLPEPSFFSDCARVLWEAVMPGVSFPAEEVCLSLMEMQTGKLRVAVKSKSWIYCKPTIDLGRDIQSIEVVTEFPAVRIRPRGSKFEIRVPPRGIVVVDVEL